MGHMTGNHKKQVDYHHNREARVQRSGREFSPLHPCSSAPLLTTTIVGILTLSFTTACSGSLAATQPPDAAKDSGIPTTVTRDDSTSETLQVPTNSFASPTPRLTASPTSTLQPTPTPMPTTVPLPTPTPRPSLRQLTSGGCCVQPYFSPDGQQVLFIDKPGEEAPIGIYAVDLTDPRPTPTLVNDIIGFRSWDGTIVATMDRNLVRFLDETSGQSWTVDTGGNWPRFSPDSSRFLWTATDQEGPYDQRLSDIWLADLDGSNAHLLLSIRGGGFAGWFPDGQRILLLSRDDPADERRTLFVYDLENDQRLNLFSHKRLRGTEISPNGTWIAFFLTFSDDPADDGIWVISSDGTTRQELDLPGFGAFRWRDDETLLYVPMRTAVSESMQLWSVDVRTGQSLPLTEPTSLSFAISNGDWEVSPDGRHVVFVNSADQNILLITLP